MFLMDVNALFAALNETHVAYASVIQWLKTVDRYASCGLTQIGTFRLLLTPAAMLNRPLRPADAHRAIARFTGTKRHILAPCPALSNTIVGQTPGHKAAVDDYLVQVADAAGCKLVTLDHALATRWPERTLLIS